MKYFPTICAVMFSVGLHCFAQGVVDRNWATTAGYNYEVFPNAVYRSIGSWKGKLDVYAPYEAKSGAPTLIWFHGGGWTRSSKEEELLYILPYLEMGWTVVNVEYRLASVARAPAAVTDVRCAVRWVANNAQKYKIDTKKIVLSGISAGGHLALMAASASVANTFDQECRERIEVKPAAVINWFGPSNVTELIAGPNSFDQAVSWIGERKDNSAMASRVSPITYVRFGLPPVITVHGENDDVIPHSQSVALHKQLEHAGVANQLVTIAKRGHGDFEPQEWHFAFSEIKQFLRKNGILGK